MFNNHRCVSTNILMSSLYFDKFTYSIVIRLSLSCWDKHYRHNHQIYHTPKNSWRLSIAVAILEQPLLMPSSHHLFAITTSLPLNFDKYCGSISTHKQTFPSLCLLLLRQNLYSSATPINNIIQVWWKSSCYDLILMFFIGSVLSLRKYANVHKLDNLFYDVYFLKQTKTKITL